MEKAAASMKGRMGRLLPWRRAPRKARGAARMPWQRRKIAVIAIIIGVVVALIELPMPAEDAFRAVRAELRSKEVSGEVVVIAVDDATVAELGRQEPSRFQDAQVVDALFKLGLKRLVFDRAYADAAATDEDVAFAEALERYRGRVWLGGSPAVDNFFQEHEGLVPIPILRSSSAIASMMGEVRPFSFSTRLPTSTYIEGAKVPSISAVLADHQGAQGWFHIDFAHDPGTVPTYSYAEVLQGRVEREAFEGKSAVLAATYFGSSDFRALPFGGRIPGVYFHALGAETLKDGMPLGLGWMPAMLLIAGVLFAQASRKRPSGTLTLWTLALLALLPIVFDLASIIIEVFPALIALVIGHVQLGRLADRIYSKSTELMLPDAIVVPDGGIRIDVYALKISNLADFAESSMPRELGAFIERVLSYLGSQSEVSPKDGATAFEKDTLIWTVPSTSRAEVEDNALALFTLLSNASWASLDDARLEVTVAADVNQGIDIERRIRNASQAADLASRQGQRIMVADQTFLDDRERRLTLLTALDRSIEEGTIAIAFQPKISMNDGRMVGAETLLRWTHATLGYVNAQELVNVAEAHGRIDQLTAYIVDLALADAKRVLAIRKDFKLAINVSAQSLREDTVPGHILSACERHEFPHANLILEVTESGKLDDVRVESRIADLCAAGLSLSIDDFGTGHSSLDYLQRVPSSEIKIDRRFVKTLRTSADSAAVVRATIEMAHSLGRVVVAEGVEDDLTAETLRQMNCDLAQGYLFSRAVPMNELLVMLNRTRAAA